MALHLCLQIHRLHPTAAASSSSKPSSYPRIKQPPIPIFTQTNIKHLTITRTPNRKTTQFTIRATATATDGGENPQANNNGVSEPQTVNTQESPPDEPQPQPTNSTNSDLSELGSEIKKAMKEREGRDGGGGGGDFWSGVAEEIREIEWPAFGKVLGTTGVVLGVIAGSSVVLLTVNAVLAELSDRVFAGKGVQDFFS